MPQWHIGNHSYKAIVHFFIVTDNVDSEMLRYTILELCTWNSDSGSLDSECADIRFKTVYLKFWKLNSFRCATCRLHGLRILRYIILETVYLEFWFTKLKLLRCATLNWLRMFRYTMLELHIWNSDSRSWHCSDSQQRFNYESLCGHFPFMMNITTFYHLLTLCTSLHSLHKMQYLNWPTVQRYTIFDMCSCHIILLFFLHVKWIQNPFGSLIHVVISWAQFSFFSFGKYHNLAIICPPSINFQSPLYLPSSYINNFAMSIFPGCF